MVFRKLVFRILVIDENFGILEVVKKCYKDGKIFSQHNIHAENITRISLKLIISFVIEISTGYLRDGFIYIKLGESKAVLLN